jgi:putative acetyltransferase
MIASLVAIEKEQIVGHIAFSTVAIESRDTATNAAALAPLAVLPAHQRRGIGTELVRHGLDHCRRAGYGAVLVLGEPAFCYRFGFIKASEHGIRCPFDAQIKRLWLLNCSPAHWQTGGNSSISSRIRRSERVNGNISHLREI